MIELKLHLSVKNMDVGQDMYIDVTGNHFIEVPHRISRSQGKCHAELNMVIRHCYDCIDEYKNNEIEYDLIQLDRYDISKDYYISTKNSATGVKNHRYILRFSKTKGKATQLTNHIKKECQCQEQGHLITHKDCKRCGMVSKANFRHEHIAPEKLYIRFEELPPSPKKSFFETIKSLFS